MSEDQKNEAQPASSEVVSSELLDSWDNRIEYLIDMERTQRESGNKIMAAHYAGRKNELVKWYGQLSNNV